MTEEEDREEIYNSVIQDFEYLNSYILNDTEKQNIITNQRYEIKKLKERLLELFRKEHKDRLEDADFERRYKEFVGESVDH